ncbi:unannotated protein [freshwater metagenome]|uniref:Unannotated protein n=1 Tax=freshwater metagenome TaxID=449393 RepID=A0A6J5YLV1_9ZZZZ
MRIRQREYLEQRLGDETFGHKIGDEFVSGEFGHRGRADRRNAHPDEIPGVAEQTAESRHRVGRGECHPRVGLQFAHRCGQRLAPISGIDDVDSGNRNGLGAKGGQSVDQGRALMTRTGDHDAQAGQKPDTLMSGDLRGRLSGLAISVHPESLGGGMFVTSAQFLVSSGCARSI